MLLLFCTLIVLSTGRRKLRTLILVVVCFGLLFFSDYLHIYSTNISIAEPIANLLLGFSFLLILDAIFVDAIVSRLLHRFSSDENKDARVTDFLFWFVAGICLPLAIIKAYVFSRLPGIVVLLGLYVSAMLAFGFYYYLHLRRIPVKYPSLAILPGYALAMTACVIVSLGLGKYVAWSAARVAGNTPYCLVDGSIPVTSTFDMSPFTLVSADGADYHVVLAVGQKQFYNWSWNSLSFTPADMEYVFFKTCSES